MSNLLRDFDRMAERLENLVNAQSHLLNDISHELRSPLARLTVDAIAGKRARTCYDAENNLDTSIPSSRARILFSWAMIPDGSGFQAKFTKALKKLIKQSGGMTDKDIYK